MRAKSLKSSQILRAHMPYFRRPGHILSISNWVIKLLIYCILLIKCFLLKYNTAQSSVHHHAANQSLFTIWLKCVCMCVRVVCVCVCMYICEHVMLMCACVLCVCMISIVRCLGNQPYITRMCVQFLL